MSWQNHDVPEPLRENKISSGFYVKVRFSVVSLMLWRPVQSIRLASSCGTGEINNNDGSFPLNSEESQHLQGPWRWDSSIELNTLECDMWGEKGPADAEAGGETENNIHKK